MIQLQSVESHKIGDNTTFVVKSPVNARRTYSTMISAIGEEVEIDGVVYSIIGFNWHVPLRDIKIGEYIEIIVRSTVKAENDHHH
jgi:hypothetical protein